MYIIKQLLSNEEVKKILNILEGDVWKEGFTAAGKSHKDNFEFTDEKLGQFIADKIKSHSISTNLLFVKQLTMPRFNKYAEGGQKYSRHVDSFIQSGVRTDWSYTLCLQKADKGGILCVEDNGQQDKADLEPGDLVIYPSGNIHQVTPVEKGTRISVIGWIESLIESPEQRKILAHLVRVMQNLDEIDGHKDNVLSLSYSYHNLMKMWRK